MLDPDQKNSVAEVILTSLCSDILLMSFLLDPRVPKCFKDYDMDYTALQALFETHFKDSLNVPHFRRPTSPAEIAWFDVTDVIPLCSRKVRAPCAVLPHSCISRKDVCSPCCADEYGFIVQANHSSDFLAEG